MYLTKEAMSIPLYVLGAILLVACIVLVIRLIKTLDKVDKILDNVDEKVNKLDGIFNIIDTSTHALAAANDKVVGFVVNSVKKIFNRKKEEDENE